MLANQLLPILKHLLCKFVEKIWKDQGFQGKKSKFIHLSGACQALRRAYTGNERTLLPFFTPRNGNYSGGCKAMHRTLLGVSTEFVLIEKRKGVT